MRGRMTDDSVIPSEQTEESFRSTLWTSKAAGKILSFLIFLLFNKKKLESQEDQ